jgi:energy-coupling factor transporter transmembrane protein EcfT
MAEEHIYQEKIQSNKTEALFLALMVLFFLLFLWRLNAGGPGVLGVVFLALSALFFFYALNYRTLIIHLSSSVLSLTFGIFTWRVPVDNIAGCALDEIPAVMRLGGAGIHFMVIRKRYRASFNFLEYPRVVVAFKRKVGPVRDISFSTHHPGEVIRLLQSLAQAEGPV